MSHPVWHAGPPDLALLNRQNDRGMNRHIGIEFLEVGDDWLKASMPVDDRTVQPYGRLHGGASVALAETVASCAGMLTLDTDRQVAVGMEINANHIRPAAPGMVYAVAKAEAIQRSTQIWTIRITDEADRLICLSRITLAVIPRDKASPL